MKLNKVKIYKILDDLKLINKIISFRSTLNTANVVILAYHRILPVNLNFDYDDEVISATPEDFEAQIKWLQNYFNFISFEDLNNGCKKPNPLIITFDDGYKDNYDYAFPILKHYGLSATIFLSTGYIATEKVFWWDEIAYLIKHATTNKILINMPEQKELLIDTYVRKLLSIKTILKYVKTIPNNQIYELVVHLRGELNGVCPNERAMLNWNEVREMSNNSIEFGSHGVNHPVMSNISQLELRDEIVISKKVIEQEINKKVIAFAYPVGYSNSYDAAAKKYLDESGYSFAASYIPGVNKNTDIEKYDLKRIHVEKENSLSELKMKILMPHIIR